MNNYSVLLFLTEKCNAKCSYCYQRNKRSIDMKLEDAIGIIEKARKSEYFNNCIEFFGGEPTLNMSLIKYIMDKYPEMTYKITTNGNFINLSKEDMDYINKMATVEISIETNEYDSKTMRNINNLSEFIDSQVIHFMNNTKAELWFNIVINVKLVNDEFESIMNKLLEYYYIYKNRFFIKLYPLMDDDSANSTDFNSNQAWFDFIYKYKKSNILLYKYLIGYFDKILYELKEETSMICECEFIAAFNAKAEMIHCTHYYKDSIAKYDNIDLDYKINVMNKEHVNKIVNILEDKCKCSKCLIKNKDHCMICRRSVDNAVESEDFSEIYKLCDRSQLRYSMLLELIFEGEQPIPLYRGDSE